MVIWTILCCRRSFYQADPGKGSSARNMTGQSRPCHGRILKTSALGERVGSRLATSASRPSLCAACQYSGSRGSTCATGAQQGCRLSRHIFGRIRLTVQRKRDTQIAQAWSRGGGGRRGCTQSRIHCSANDTGGCWLCQCVDKNRERRGQQGRRPKYLYKACLVVAAAARAKEGTGTSRTVLISGRQVEGFRGQG